MTISRSKRSAEDERFEIWFARPEDIIVGKLMAWQTGRSAKHPADIYTVLSFILSGLADLELDIAYVTGRAKRIGEDAMGLWLSLLDRVKRELAAEGPSF